MYRLLWRMAQGGDMEEQRAARPAGRRPHAGPMVRAPCGATCTRCTPLCAFGPWWSRMATPYMAWFEPDHYITEANAGFFIRRFTQMRWAILTPDASVRWDGQHCTLAPAPSAATPAARCGRGAVAHLLPPHLQPRAAQAHHDEKEMPTRYWHNLPEAALITELAQTAHERSAKMVEAEATTPRRRIAGKGNTGVKSHPAGAQQRGRAGWRCGFASAAQPENPGINAGARARHAHGGGQFLQRWQPARR